MIIHEAGCGWETGPYCTCGADPERMWDFGDPLPGTFRSTTYQGFLYNFREIVDDEECHCADRASWPTPAFHELPSEEWFIDYFKAQLGIENG